MIQDYDLEIDDVTFLQTANPTPAVDFGWKQ